VRAAQPQCAIVRTSWVFDAEGANFVRTMLRLAMTRERIGVVHDQIGAPSYAPHVAEGLLQLARQLRADRALAVVYHVAAAGRCSWAEFAEAIFAGAKARGGPHAQVDRIGSADFPTAARRPANSVLDCNKAAAVGIALPDWRVGLNACLDALAARGWDVA
jgi:dTDP-4-dehydrorhamnose reductase